MIGVVVGVVVWGGRRAAGAVCVSLSFHLFCETVGGAFARSDPAAPPPRSTPCSTPVRISKSSNTHRGEILIGGPVVASGYFVDGDNIDPELIVRGFAPIYPRIRPCFSSYSYQIFRHFLDPRPLAVLSR